MKEFQKGDKKEAVKACWPAIISRTKFQRVEQLLKKNRYMKKTPSKRRYPYLLSGRIVCACCSGVLSGKSAHGKCGKVGYYEHNDAVTKIKYYFDESFTCKSPRRFLAKKVHKLVLEKAREILSNEQRAKELFERIKEIEKNDPIQRERGILKGHIVQISAQIDSLVDRLSELPKGVSATPIYKRMQELEQEKDKLQRKIDELELVESTDESISLKNWLELGKKVIPLLDFTEGDSLEKEKLITKIISKLIYKIELGSNSMKIHYFVGEDHYKKAALESAAFLNIWCSTSFTNGGEQEIRTPERFYPLHAFQACAFNHSANSPRLMILGNYHLIAAKSRLKLIGDIISIPFSPKKIGHNFGAFKMSDSSNDGKTVI